MLVDVHSHFSKDNIYFEDILKKNKERNINLILQACDYKTSLSYVDSFNFFKYPFHVGLHPLYINKDELSLLDNYVSFLKEKGLIGIGEVGIDARIINTISFEVQEEVLRFFLKLAYDHNLVVSIHCVKAYDKLFKILKDYDVKYIVHGFIGSIQIAKVLKDKFNCYFSISKKAFNSPKTVEAIKYIGPNHILCESDYENKFCYNVEDLFVTFSTLVDILCTNSDNLLDEMNNSLKFLYRENYGLYLFN